MIVLLRGKICRNLSTRFNHSYSQQCPIDSDACQSVRHADQTIEGVIAQCQSAAQFENRQHHQDIHDLEWHHEETTIREKEPKNNSAAIETLVAKIVAPESTAFFVERWVIAPIAGTAENMPDPIMSPMTMASTVECPSFLRRVICFLFVPQLH